MTVPHHGSDDPSVTPHFQELPVDRIIADRIPKADTGTDTVDSR